MPAHIAKKRQSNPFTVPRNCAGVRHIVCIFYPGILLFLIWFSYGG